MSNGLSTMKVGGGKVLRRPKMDEPRVILRQELLPELLAKSAVLSEALHVSPVCAKVLYCRGVIEPEQAQAFLFPSLREHLPDPTQIKNIEKAAAIILEAIEGGQRIAVFSDFDVDGLTAAAQLMLFFKRLEADAVFYVPNRFTEGYGLSAAAVDKLAGAGCTLLVTLDCGISSVAEIARAKRLGMKTVVVDHHQPGLELPPAEVIVDPEQDDCPFKKHKLAAAGLALMLVIVLRNMVLADKTRTNGKAKELPSAKEFLDLAALGTICDMVPLVGVNRVLAYRGLEAIQQSTRAGIIALKEVAGFSPTRRLTCSNISFAIGPRINAAGRLSDATSVLTLLTSDNESEAKSVAQLIDNLNSERKAIEELVLKSCFEQLRDFDEQSVVSVYGEDFHSGVIGIVAQRLVEEYYRPAVVMAPGEAIINGQPCRVIKGSVRSIRGFHVAQVLQELDSLLIGHGGHEAAGGFTVALDRLDQFQEQLQRIGARILTPELLHRELTADVKVSLAEVDYVLADELQRLAPFGIGNPAPVFVTEGVTVDSASLVGQNHLRLRLSEGECRRNAVGWGMYGHPRLRRGETINIAYTVEINTYQGISSVQLNLKGIWS